MTSFNFHVTDRRRNDIINISVGERIRNQPYCTIMCHCVTVSVSHVSGIESDQLLIAMAYLVSRNLQLPNLNYSVEANFERDFIPYHNVLCFQRTFSMGKI